jgi:hypothetical protein
LGGDLSHAVSLEGEAVSIVDEVVEDSVGDGWVGSPGTLGRVTVEPFNEVLVAPKRQLVLLNSF